MKGQYWVLSVKNTDNLAPHRRAAYFAKQKRSFTEAELTEGSWPVAAVARIDQSVRYSA